MVIIILFIAGLILGSFLGAWTYRLPRNISINEGRSLCPNCKVKINWYDNIPVLSFLLLKGRCRSCHKPISIRYPLIELTSAILFAISPLISLISLVPISFLLVFIFLLLAIFVIDLEHQIIPDEITFLLLLVVLTYTFIFSAELFWVNLLSGFTASLFLLILNIGTKGRGMGLGDVKLAIPMGIFLGFPLVLIWLFTSFVIGSLWGVGLLMFGLVGLKSKLAFGPFLVISFFITLLIGRVIIPFVLPWI